MTGSSTLPDVRVGFTTSNESCSRKSSSRPPWRSLSWIVSGKAPSSSGTLPMWNTTSPLPLQRRQAGAELVGVGAVDGLAGGVAHLERHDGVLQRHGGAVADPDGEGLAGQEVAPVGLAGMLDAHA